LYRRCCEEQVVASLPLASVHSLSWFLVDVNAHLLARHWASRGLLVRSRTFQVCPLPQLAQQVGCCQPWLHFAGLFGIQTLRITCPQAEQERLEQLRDTLAVALEGMNDQVLAKPAMGRRGTAGFSLSSPVRPGRSGVQSTFAMSLGVKRSTAAEVGALPQSDLLFRLSARFCLGTLGD
jgi:hypothetical protein